MIFCLIEIGAWVAIIAFLVFLVVMVLSDGDVLLMFTTRFGKPPGSMAGKVVWITGASSGIGEYMAYCLAEAGCKLVLSARRKEELERVKQACVKSSKGKLKEDDILVLPLDVVAYETHKHAVQQVLEYFNKIDVLVNNAGRSQQAGWMSIELNVDRSLFETNVLGQVSLTQEVLPHMIQRKQGHIAVMSSLAGKMGVPMARSYAGTKHALQGYFECLRTEMGEHNIDVTMICPGPVFSDLYREAATGKDGENLGKTMQKTDKRMSTERCAYLSCVALANKLYETWITQQPILVSIYITQYMPDLGRWILKKTGVKVAQKLREGK